MKTLQSCVFLPALFTLFNSSTVNASEDNLFFEMPVVLSASRLEQPASEAPIAISSIDRQMIEASAARNIPDVLRLVPGMIVGNSANEFGDEPKIVVAYHGHSNQFSRQMQVLIDGRSIYEPLIGGVAWNMIPINIDDIERIEVSRGPNASTYGSNSFFAVINIITRHAAEDQGHYIKANAGNHDIADLTYRYGGNNGELDYRITMTSQNDDGQDTVEGTDNHDDANANAFDYRLDYQITNNSQLTYQGGYGKTVLQANRNFSTNGIKPVRDITNTSAHQFLKLETTTDSNNTYVVQYYYNLLNKKDKFTSNVFDVSQFSSIASAILGVPITLDNFSLNLDSGIKSERHNLEFTHFNQATDNLRIVWGLSAQTDIAESIFRLSGNKISRDTFRIFTNSEWRISKKNILNFGLLLERTETTSTDNSPRIALIHKLTEKHSLRFGISKATRSPFIAEEFGTQILRHDLTSGGIPLGTTLVDQQLIPNNNIDNEKIISREIGYYGRFFGDDLLFNVRLFRDDLEDFIESQSMTFSLTNLPTILDLNNTTAQFINNSSTTLKGIELEFDYRPDRSLRFIVSAAYLDIHSHDDPTISQVRVLKRSAPDTTASLLTIKQFNAKYSGSLGLYYVDDMSWPDAQSNVSNDYTTMDLKLTRKIQLTDGAANLSFILKNVLDEYNNYDPNPANGPLLEQNLTTYIELKVSHR